MTAGEVPAEELGIEAVDDYTLRIYTEAPVPYLPMLGVWFLVMPENSQEELGENWALDPERFVSSGPWTLKEFQRGVGHKWALNTTYAGVRKTYLTEIREETLPTGLPAYISGELQTYAIGAKHAGRRDRPGERQPGAARRVAPRHRDRHRLSRFQHAG